MYIIGANGYIGQRLLERVSTGIEAVHAIDACILAPPRPGITQARVEDIDVPAHQDVIWLASFHDSPQLEKLTIGERLEWVQVARKIMVELPLKWARRARTFTYVSSMRALTHPDTFYGALKRRAEQTLLDGATNVRIVRFGTVYGGLSPSLYNRTITVPNRWLVHRVLPNEGWKAYVTSMNQALVALRYDSEVCEENTIRNFVSSPARPWTSADLEWFLQPLSQPLLTPEPHPAALMAQFYNLPWPKEAAPCTVS